MASGISASTIKSWFQYRCERKTRYELMDDEERAAVPVLKLEGEPLWAALGNEYEARVISALARDHAVLRPAIGEDALRENLAVAFLTGRRSERYAAQINLRPRSTPALIAGTDLKVRRTFADLVSVERTGPKPVFRVIDIKATRRATAFHKTQVAFYTRMLEAVLLDLKIDAKLDLNGEIWRIPDNGSVQGSDYQAEIFDLRPYLRMVDAFCGSLLPQIAATTVVPGRDDTFFHVYFKCEQCPYLPHCERWISSNRPPASRDVSAVAGLTHEAKRSLHRLNIRSVADLANAPGVGRMDGIGWSLQRRAEVLRVRARALAENRVLRSPEEQTFLMPPRVDVAIHILADHDPVDDALVTVGYSIVQAGEERRLVEVIPSADRQAEADALFRVFEALISDLTQIDEFNRNLGDHAPNAQRAHIFFYEPSEVTNLHGAVARHLDDARIRAGLLNIVRLFPPDDVVPEPEFRGAHHLPATAVRNVVEQLYALPVSVAYDLRQVSQALAQEGAIAQMYEPQPGFERPFSSLLSIDVIRGLREARPTSPDTAAVRIDVGHRLDALRDVVEWLFAENEREVAAGRSPLLRLNKKPFRFHATFDPLNADDLDVLRALELLESRAGLLDTLVNLAQPASRRRDAGRCIAGMRLDRLRPPPPTGRRRQAYLGFFVPPESRGSDLRATAFDLILTDDDPDLRLDPSAWPDCAVRILPPRPGRPEQFLTIAVDASVFNSATFQAMLTRAGDRPVWHIDRSFNDLNTERAARFIGRLITG